MAPKKHETARAQIPVDRLDAGEVDDGGDAHAEDHLRDRDPEGARTDEFQILLPVARGFDLPAQVVVCRVLITWRHRWVIYVSMLHCERKFLR